MTEESASRVGVLTPESLLQGYCGPMKSELVRRLEVLAVLESEDGDIVGTGDISEMTERVEAIERRLVRRWFYCAQKRVIGARCDG